MTTDVETAIIGFFMQKKCDKKDITKSKRNLKKSHHLEFAQNQKNKYFSNGSEKAKGIEFSIDYPKSWINKNGDRPNIVQKFTSMNEASDVQFLILITENSNNSKVTEIDISKIISSEKINNYLPQDSTIINKGLFTLENLPGFWVSYIQKVSRLNYSFEIEVIAYTLFYENKLIQLMGSVPNGTYLSLLV